MSAVLQLPLLDPAEELAAAKADPEGRELSPAAQALYEAEGAARFAAHHPAARFSRPYMPEFSDAPDGVDVPALADQLFTLAGRIRDLPDGVMLPPAERDRDPFLNGFAQGHRAARMQAAGFVEDASRGVMGTQGDKP